MTAGEPCVLSSVVEANGKTIRENNLAKKHAIPAGTLVEVKYDDWWGDGACIKAHARLWVTHHHRDCDGTPLYGLSKRPDPAERNVVNGLGAESLTPIEVDDSVRRGDGAFQWDDDEA